MKLSIIVNNIFDVGALKYQLEPGDTIYQANLIQYTPRIIHNLIIRSKSSLIVIIHPLLSRVNDDFLYRVRCIIKRGTSFLIREDNLFCIVLKRDNYKNSLLDVSVHGTYSNVIEYFQHRYNIREYNNNHYSNIPPSFNDFPLPNLPIIIVEPILRKKQVIEEKQVIDNIVIPNPVIAYNFDDIILTEIEIGEEEDE